MIQATLTDQRPEAELLPSAVTRCYAPAHPPGRQLRVRLIEGGYVSVPGSWERILVDAGLDREARELSPAESRMADMAAGEREVAVV
jgi:hypothetical protein